MKKFLVFFFFLMNSLHCQDDLLPEFHVKSIAKSGTHLLKKAIHLLLNDYKPIFTFIPSPLFNKNQYYWGHFPLSEWERQFYSKKNLIIMVRDPRDICVSMLYAIKEEDDEKGRLFAAFYVGKAEIDKFKMLQVDDQLMYIIKKDFPVFSLNKSLPDTVNTMSWKNVLLVRYENLVGEKGGGSSVLQLQELKKIAQFLNISLPEVSLCQIASELYGVESHNYLPTTFREGKIGSWKTIFKEEHKEAFKQKFGSYLISLGYEKDDQW